MKINLKNEKLVVIATLNMYIFVAKKEKKRKKVLVSTEIKFNQLQRSASFLYFANNYLTSIESWYST